MEQHFHYVVLRLTSSEHPPDEPDPLGDGKVELLVDGRTLAAEVVSTTCEATPRTSP
jgi:hypothetical protein